MLILLLACLSKDEATGAPADSSTEETDVESDTGDSGDSGDTGETGDTGDTGDTGEVASSFYCQVPELIVARAGPNQVLASGTLSLDGSASTGPGALEHRWTLTVESASGTTTETFETAALSYDLPEGFESLSARLVVSSAGDSHKDFVLVHATDTLASVEVTSPEAGALGETFTFTSTGESGKLIESPAGSTATGTSFVADKGGIYSVRFASADGDTAIGRVYVSAPVLEPWDYALVGEYQISATGFESWTPDATVRWTIGESEELLNPDTPTGTCVSFTIEEGGHYELKAVIRDAAGELLDREYPELVFLDNGSVAEDVALMPKSGGTGIVGQWLTSEGLARLELGVLSQAPLPYTGAWTDIVSDGPTQASPLEASDGLAWILGYDGDGVYRLEGGAATKLDLATWDPEWWLVGDLNDDGASEYGLEAGLYDAMANKKVLIAKHTNEDDDYVQAELRQAQAADYNGDGVTDLVLVHELSEYYDSSCGVVEHETALLLGPISTNADLDTPEATFEMTHCARRNPAVLASDMDHDGYTDFVYGAAYQSTELAQVGLGGAKPDWSNTLHIEGPIHFDYTSALDATQDTLLINAGGMRYGVLWSIPLPLSQETTSAIDSQATVRGGSQEIVLKSAKFGDLDGDASPEIFGFGVASWWTQ